MKRVAAKSADNGLAVAARMAESCANDIDGFPPRKSSAEPDSFASGRFTHWNGLAVQTDNQHRPFIHARAAQLDHFIVGEMPCRETIASDSPGGERECLPGVSYVVQAVPIGPFTVLPLLAPHDTGQNKYNWRGAVNCPRSETTVSALLRHVSGR